MELLGNEYHLIGPLASPTKRNSCSFGCKCRTVSRRRRSDDDRARFPRRRPRRDPRSPGCEECLGTSAVDLVDSGSIFRPTGVSADDNADRRDGEFNADGYRNDRRRRDGIGTERREDHAAPVPGPSGRSLAASPAGNAKRARVDGRGARGADETDDETTEEEDADCPCDIVTRDEHGRVRPPDRPRVRNQRRNGRRDDAGEDEEDEGERMRREDEGDTEEDSAYEELRARGPRGTAARERELRGWIRRCRQECERRRGR